MSYVGNKPAQTTIPADDSVTTAMLKDDAVTSVKIDDGTITSTDMAVDPRNASNLNAGDVPLAQLDNAPATDVTGLEDDIALLGFRVASNGSLAKYNLVDQTVDDFQDASGVDASASTNEARNTAGKYYSGAVDASATGGTITTYGSYKVHTFAIGDTGDDWTPPSSGNVDVLVVGGGGSGGSPAGGGGAGGFRTSASHAVTAQAYEITVGAGGVSIVDGAAANGGNTVFDTITSAGGGKGGKDNTGGGDGGSGGGESQIDGTGAGSGNTPSTSPSQGNNGGTEEGTTTANPSGGGGGAGAVGGNASGSTAGSGGAGSTNDYQTGVSQTYAGGGGGGAYSGSSFPGGVAGSGGSGGGGAGGVGAAGTGGTAGSGGGGGGGGYNQTTGHKNGGTGGSGIVVIRYATDEFEAFDNMTLISTTTAAQAAPTKGDIVLTYTNGAGTTTLDTDLTAEISADGGSTWTALALGSEGSTGSHNIATSHDVTISSTITAPYNMAYRIKTLNQSASKTTRIQAVSLGWS